MAMKKTASDSAGPTARRELIRPAAFVIALALLMTGTLWMHFQPGVPDPLRPVEAFSRQWWLYPVERNAFMRLPLVSNEPDKLFVLPNSTHAWVGGGEPSAVLLHTADLGETWEAITVASSQAPARLLSGDIHSSAGLSSANDGEISEKLRASPEVHGGVAANPPTKSSGTVEIVDFYFADSSRGWVLDRNGQILDTRDGGKSWSSQRLEGSDYSALAGSGSRLVAGGSEILSSSVDGGARWQNVALKDTPITAVQIAVDGRVWFGTNNGGVYWTTDSVSREVSAGGKGQGRIRRVFFSTPNCGVVESIDRVRVTTDGGRTWAERNGFVSMSNGDLYATAGDASGALAPEDAVSHPPDALNFGRRRLLAVGGFSDQKHAIALGEHGQIFTTSDQVRVANGQFFVVRAGELWRRTTIAYGFARAIHSGPNGKRLWTAGNAGVLLTSDDFGETWKPIENTSHLDFSAITFDATGTHGSAVGNSIIVQTNDGGRRWEPLPAIELSGGLDPLFEAVVLREAVRNQLPPELMAAIIESESDFQTRLVSTKNVRRLAQIIDPTSPKVRELISSWGRNQKCAISVDGVPLRSLDGGKTWLEPQYRRFPAPWYYLTFAPVALLLFISMRKPAPIHAASSIEDVPWNDRPLTEPAADRLDYQPLAAGIARFFGNRGTEPPLTIAITGPWGSGKSSLMNLVADAVKRYDYRPVWFNAWHYQSEEFLLPAVLESLRAEAVPRFWTLHGLQFRMRLLVLRGMKNWLPALVIMAVLVTTAAYFMRDHDAFRQLIENLRNLGSEKSDKFFESAGLVISSFLSIVVVFRSLNAFGVSGTKIAALLSGSVRLADAGGQTGFRHHFARAFGEVTRALDGNRLVLFIDDLDRCRPDHVLSVLECINFLVTSGDCFIIAGMDRPRVERFVAMRFQDESNAIGAAADVDCENAQLYLEKLINIEIPVPLAPSLRSRELFASDRKETTEERVRATVFGERLIAFGQAAIPWVVGLAVLSSSAYLGYAVLPDRYRHQVPPQSAAASPTPPVARASVGTPKQPSPEKQTNARPPTRFVRPIMPNRREVLPIAGILLIVIFGIVRLSIERAKLEQDSEDFRTALRQWHPLLYAANATPRSMKRCVNRVRYYAMRQRTNPLPPTLMERLRQLLHRLRRIAPLQDDTVLLIPENILVPVSVVQHIFPHWLDDDEFWRDPAEYVKSRHPPDELADGIASLHSRGSIEDYRGTFTRISAGIHVAGAAGGHAANAAPTPT